MASVNIDLDAANPTRPDVPTQVAEDKDVVFVAFEDTELTVNNMTLKFTARAPKKVTRDQARILMEANKGYLRD